MHRFVCNAILWSGLALASAAFTPSASAACSGDPLKDCMDAASDAHNKANSTSNPVEKARAAGEAVGNCVNCAVQSLGNQIRQLAPNNSPRQR